MSSQVHQLTRFTCVQTEPFAEYIISVRAFTWKNQGDASNVVIQRTDISGPSPPIIVNLTCKAFDTLYVRWKRPLEFYNSIDFYIMSYKSSGEHNFQEIRFNASAKHLETGMLLPNLTTNMLYEVKVRAASISTIKPNQLILGAYSEVKKVCFDVDGVGREALWNREQMQYKIFALMSTVV